MTKDTWREELKNIWAKNNYYYEGGMEDEDLEELEELEDFIQEALDQQKREILKIVEHETYETDHDYSIMIIKEQINKLK